MILTATDIAMVELSHLHRFEPATLPGRPAVLLLHGTGGDENDLLLLGRTVAPGSALISPRGQVLEKGAPRFFRRLAVFVGGCTLEAISLIASCADAS